LDAGSSEEALTEEQSLTDSTSEMATSTGEPGSAAPFQSAIMGAHAFWLLDFDKCQVLPKERQAVERAAALFMMAEPFHPKPWAGNEKDEEYWKEFRQKFLDTSTILLRDAEGERDLALYWVEKAEAIALMQF
jgi:hypothetical protein